MAYAKVSKTFGLSARVGSTPTHGTNQSILTFSCYSNKISSKQGKDEEMKRGLCGRVIGSVIGIMFIVTILFLCKVNIKEISLLWVILYAVCLLLLYVQEDLAINIIFGFEHKDSQDLYGFLLSIFPPIALLLEIVFSIKRIIEEASDSYEGDSFDYIGGGKEDED